MGRDVTKEHCGGPTSRTDQPEPGTEPHAGGCDLPVRPGAPSTRDHGPPPSRSRCDCRRNNSRSLSSATVPASCSANWRSPTESSAVPSASSSSDTALPNVEDSQVSRSSKLSSPTPTASPWQRSATDSGSALGQRSHRSESSPGARCRDARLAWTTSIVAGVRFADPHMLWPRSALTANSPHVVQYDLGPVVGDLVGVQARLEPLREPLAYSFCI